MDAPLPPPFDACPDMLAPLLRGLAAGPQMVVLYDPDDVIRYANLPFCEAYIVDGMVNISFDTMIRRAFAHGIGSIPWHKDVEAFLQDVATRRRCAPRYECAVNLVDGRWIWLTETLMPDGWQLTVGTDITEFKRSEKTLRQAHGDALYAAWTDALTGLPNRRRALDVLRDALDTKRTLPAPLSIAMIDLDHFKDINDRVGHAGGDVVLQHFAASCSSHLRSGDMIGRIGGEEFLVMLPACELDSATRLMHALRGVLANEPMPDVLAGQRYTISVGLAMAQPGDTVGSLMHRADQALYAAKRGGRDQVQRWPAGTNS